jgi:plasmid stabilization system protein ParE
MRYSIRITATALAEIDRALDWYIEQSASAAARWYDRVLAAIESLAENPQRCGLAPEKEWFGAPIRQLLVGKRRGVYRVIFEIRNTTVYVLRVRHGSRDFLNPGEL